MKIKKLDITDENLTPEVLYLFCLVNTWIDRIDSIFSHKK
jgi:hypothetical protein